MHSQALASTRSVDAAAALLECSKPNIHVLMGNLEFELGRFTAGDESGHRATSGEDSKLKLTQAVKKEMQLTPAGETTSLMHARFETGNLLMDAATLICLNVQGVSCSVIATG